MDLMIPPDFQIELKKRFEETDIQYDVIIHDLQAAIDKENPKPNVTDSGDDYDNRFSNSSDSIHSVLSLTSLNFLLLLSVYLPNT